MNQTLLDGFLFIFLICASYSKLCRDPKEFLELTEDYNTEIHSVTTEDGYDLTLFRVRAKSSPTPSILGQISTQLNDSKQKGKLLPQINRHIQKTTSQLIFSKDEI